MHTPYVNLKRQSRLIGALFLSAIVFYGVGFSLVTSVVGTPALLAAVSAHEGTLRTGALLMLLNSVVVVGLGVLLFTVLEPRGQRTALAYLAARVVEAVLLAVGVVCLLGIRGLGSVAIQANAMSYQVAMMSLGFGGVLMCGLLFRTRLIPRFLALWGLIGYAILLAGANVEVFGIHAGLLLSIPGGLFEVALGFWLLSNGFRSEMLARDGAPAGQTDVAVAA